MEKRLSNEMYWYIIKLSILIAASTTYVLTMLTINYGLFLMLFSCIGVGSIVLYLSFSVFKRDRELDILYNSVGTTKLELPANTSETVWPFHAKKPLTVSEKMMYFRLCQALPDYIFLPQVPFIRFISIKADKDHMKWFGRIIRMSADFVVCDTNFEIIAVINVEDDTMMRIRDDRQLASKEKNMVLASAGLRMISWSTSTIPSIAKIQEEFSEKMETSPDLIALGV